jgi:hypothetical protein
MAFDLNVLIQVANVLSRFIPQPKPPRTDYTTLIEAMPRYSALPQLQAPTPLPESHAPLVTTPVEVTSTDVATSCLACSRSHLTTIAGALDEALRFARDEGVTSSEVLKRIDIAEREINIMERIDLSPDAIANSPEEEQEFVRPFMPKIRELRQNIGQIRSVDKLEETAAEANTVSREFKIAQMGMEPSETVESSAREVGPEDRVKVMENRLRKMQENGVNLNPVIELAHQVQNGEISLEEAKERVRELLPEEV